MTTKFSASDKQQMAALGLSETAVEHQIENFRKGFPYTELVAAATVENGGILRMDDEAINRYAAYYEQAS